MLASKLGTRGSKSIIRVERARSTTSAKTADGDVLLIFHPAINGDEHRCLRFWIAGERRSIEMRADEVIGDDEATLSVGDVGARLLLGDGCQIGKPPESDRLVGHVVAAERQTI